MTDPVPSRRSSVASRRTLRRQSSALSNMGSALDIFGDDNAIDFNPVADGFGPGQYSNATPRPATPSSIIPEPQLPPRAASPPRVTEYLKKRLAGQERVSGPGHRSSLSTTRRETPASQRVSLISTATDSPVRPLSTASGLSTPVSEHPYTVSSGSGHPYALYPQLSSLNRSGSTSTIQTQNRPYSGPSRPTHPYALYPQIPGSSSELVDPFSDPADIANVGFPGLGQTYARRIGPDGEDADDLIGPDGHTEQLPPYSRFPENVVPKERADVEDSRAPLLTSAAPIPLNSSPDLHDEVSASASLLDNEEGLINRGAGRDAGLEEESNRTARWRKKSKQLTCWGRIPVWAWILFVFVLCMVAATLGAVIGKALHGPPPYPTNSTSAQVATSEVSNEGSLPNSTTVWQTVTTTLIDATPLSTTPTDLIPLPIGTFAVPIQDSGITANQCLRDGQQKYGWSCNSRAFLTLFTQSMGGASNFVTLSAEYPEDYPLLYGAQAPTMQGPAVVNLMKDLGDPDKGPAYYFQQLYDKLVIVTDQQLSSATKPAYFHSPQRSHTNNYQDIEPSDPFGQDGDDFTGYFEPGKAWPRRKVWKPLSSRDSDDQPVLTGDNPWYCFWNSTILEGFIYATMPSHPNRNETDFIASVIADSVVTGAPTLALPNDESSDWASRKNAPQETGSSTYNQPQSTTVASSPPTSAYPLVVKIEERRSSGMPQPYCQQMSAQRDGTIVPKVDSNGNRIMFNLTELQAVSQHNLQPSGSENTDSRRRHISAESFDLFQRDDDGSDSSCKCQWLFE